MSDLPEIVKQEMIETAKRAISDLDIEIATLNDSRDVWIKIIGKIEGELYGRIMP